jgi:hypothetical protein
MSKQMKYGPNGYEPIEPEPPAGSNHKVGYKSPPKHTRWKKGQSGNPKGRKKRRIVNDLSTLFHEILVEEIKVREGGRVRKITTLEAIIQACINSALGANTNALRRLCGLGERTGMLSKRELDAELPFTLIFPRDADEEEILRRHRAEQAQLAREMEPRDSRLQAPVIIEQRRA